MDREKPGSQSVFALISFLNLSISLDEILCHTKQGKYVAFYVSIKCFEQVVSVYTYIVPSS